MTAQEPVTSYPIIIVTTMTYRVWVEDWDEIGPDELVKHLDDAGDAYELLTRNGVSIPTIDGWLDVRAPEWGGESHDNDRLGPLPQCLEPGCEMLCYYDRWCHKHRPAKPADG